ncbi:hypothetical protein PAMP_017945 [Pampus punctatissimus]
MRDYYWQLWVQKSTTYLPLGRHASLPVEVSEIPLNLIAPPCRRSYPCRKWKSASFGCSARPLANEERWGEMKTLRVLSSGTMQAV